MAHHQRSTSDPQPLFDSHCHLTDAAFAGEVDAVLGRARAAGVTGIVTIASDVADAGAAESLAAAHADVWWTAGVHPHVAAAAGDDAPGRLRELLARPGAVAVGETGLDYHYDHSPRDVQRRVFTMQIELARGLGLPIVVHARDADADMIAMIRECSDDMVGVLHCFSSGAPVLEAGLEAGWYVSFSGMVTFRNYRGAELLRSVPDDRLLIETDAPYLAPVPFRGRRNEPAYVANTCAAAAALRGVEASDLAFSTTANARRLYRLDAPARLRRA